MNVQPHAAKPHTVAPSMIFAKNSTPAGIDAAFELQRRYMRPGLLGPGPLPVVIIPCAAGVVARQPTRRAPVVAKPWTPPHQVIGGCAATYGTTVVHAGRRETTNIYAFGAAKNDGEIYLTIDHREDLRLASRLEGSLRLFETSDGLFFEAHPFATPDARRAHLLPRAQRGEFIGASVRYGPEWGRERADGTRVMRRANYLIEVSLLTRAIRPIDPGTWIGIGVPGHLSRPRR